jgi:hypothetical protein
MNSKEACDEFWDSFEKANPDWQWQARHVSDHRAAVRFAIWQAASERQRKKDADICKEQFIDPQLGLVAKSFAEAILNQKDE